MGKGFTRNRDELCGKMVKYLKILFKTLSCYWQVFNKAMTFYKNNKSVSSEILSIL